MNTTDILAPEETGNPEADPAAPAAEPLPPECNPARHLNWRFRYALYLVDHGGGPPITHEDPWIQAAIDFRLAHDARWENRELRPVDHAIFHASRLWQTDCLAKHLLEARLLAQQPPAEIAARCALPILTITAYAQLHFDVRGRDRRGIWMLHPLSTGVFANTRLWQFGWALKQMACFTTGEELEKRIKALCRLDGKTMAAGLPARTDPAFPAELTVRLALADLLLPATKSTEKLRSRLQEAAARDLQAGRSSQESVDLALQVLRRAKLPESLHKEIRSLRESSPATAEVAAPTADEGERAETGDV